MDIKIVGNQKDDVLNLYELNDKNDTVALIKGTVSDLVIKGVWVSTTNKKSYSLILSKINRITSYNVCYTKLLRVGKGGAKY